MDKAVFDLNTEGHRESYFQIFERLWGATRFVGLENLLKANSAEHLVFLSVDDYFLRFLVQTLKRSFQRKKTDGILLRAENLTQQNWTLKRLFKKILLRILKKIPGVRMIGIVPFQFLPELKPYLTDTLFDLQFWDLPILFPKIEASPQANIKFETLREKAKGRKIVLALGRQDESKGILFFFNLWQHPEIQKNYFFGVIGKNRTVNPFEFDNFEKAGGFVWNETVSETDLISAYEKADLIWCCYHPSYDVSSGIYGRSLQTGRASLIREGSLLSRFAEQFRSSARLNYNDVNGSAKKLLSLHLDSKKPKADLKSDFSRLYLSNR